MSSACVANPYLCRLLPIVILHLLVASCFFSSFALGRTTFLSSLFPADDRLPVHPPAPSSPLHPSSDSLVNGAPSFGRRNPGRPRNCPHPIGDSSAAPSTCIRRGPGRPHKLPRATLGPLSTPNSGIWRCPGSPLKTTAPQTINAQHLSPISPSSTLLPPATSDLSSPPPATLPPPVPSPADANGGGSPRSSSSPRLVRLRPLLRRPPHLRQATVSHVLPVVLAASLLLPLLRRASVPPPTMSSTTSSTVALDLIMTSPSQSALATVLTSAATFSTTHLRG